MDQAKFLLFFALEKQAKFSTYLLLSGTKRNFLPIFWTGYSNLCLEESSEIFPIFWTLCISILFKTPFQKPKKNQCLQTHPQNRHQKSGQREIQSSLIIWSPRNSIHLFRVPFLFRRREYALNELQSFVTGVYAPNVARINYAGRNWYNKELTACALLAILHSSSESKKWRQQIARPNSWFLSSKTSVCVECSSPKNSAH
jgi:hypothetical protein